MERNVDINFLLLHLKYAFKEERKGLNKQANKQIWQPHRHTATTKCAMDAKIKEKWQQKENPW